MRSTFRALVAAALIAIPASWPADPSIRAAEPPAPTLPEEDPEFQRLLAELARRADEYRQEALGFRCRESVIEAKYNIETSSHKNSKNLTFDYLFVRRDGILREYRQMLVKTRNDEWKRRKADFEPPLPPAYLWSSLFSSTNKGRFHFRPAGQVVRAYRLLHLIDFTGISPNPGGTDISGWSGQVAVDARSHNLWSITAQPTGQEVRLEVEILKYNRAFAIAGVPLASRPHGWLLEIVFGFEREGLSYPTQQTLSMTSLARSQDMRVEEKTTFRYERYEFFETEITAEEYFGEVPLDPTN